MLCGLQIGLKILFGRTQRRQYAGLNDLGACGGLSVCPGLAGLIAEIGPMSVVEPIQTLEARLCRVYKL